jgi:hypothetical protein
MPETKCARRRIKEDEGEVRRRRMKRRIPF